MITETDIDSLRESFATWPQPGLPPTLATEWAGLLGVSDLTISFVGTSEEAVLGSSSDDARIINEWEFTFQEGPRVDAVAKGTSQCAGTAPSETNPWPRLSAKARSAGYLSLAAIPWRVGEATFATVNLHHRPGAITPATIAATEHIADELTTALVDSLSLSLISIQSGDRDAFHQATGMVMRQMSTDVAGAARALRAHAWSQDRLLIDVAGDVVARVFTLAPGPGAENGDTATTNGSARRTD